MCFSLNSYVNYTILNVTTTPDSKMWLLENFRLSTRTLCPILFFYKLCSLLRVWKNYFVIRELVFYIHSVLNARITYFCYKIIKKILTTKPTVLENKKTTKSNRPELFARSYFFINCARFWESERIILLYGNLCFTYIRFFNPELHTFVLNKTKT